MEVLHSSRLLLDLLHAELAAQDFDEPDPHERSPPAAEYSVADVLMLGFRICLGSKFLSLPSKKFLKLECK